MNRARVYPVDRSDIVERLPLLWFGLLTVLLAIQQTGVWSGTNDSVKYLTLARDFAENPDFVRLGYNPAYPLLLSVFFHFSDTPFRAIGALHLFLTMVFLAGVFRLARHRCPEDAVKLTVFVGANVMLWELHRVFLTELTFVATLVWAVAVLDRSEPTGVRSAIGGAVLASLVVTVRYVGLVVAIGFAAVCLVRARREPARRWWHVLIGAVVLVPALLTFASVQGVERAGVYAGVVDPGDVPIAPPVTRVLEGLHLRVSDVGRLLLPGMVRVYQDPGDWLDANMLLYGPLFLALVPSWWALVRRADLFAFVGVQYFALCVLNPFQQSTRYTFPLLPLLVIILWMTLNRGTSWVWGTSAATSRRRASWIWIALIAAHLVFSTSRWLLVDEPRLREAWAAWPVATRLAAVVAPVDGGLAIVGAPDAGPFTPALRSYLQFQLNRPVGQLAPGARLPGTLDVIIMPVNAQMATPGFRAIDRVAGHVVFRRAPS